MAFLAQFYCDPVRLRIDGTLCVHLYQCADGEGDPQPLAVAVRHGAPLNTKQLGTSQRSVEPLDVQWEERDEPDSEPPVDANDFSDLPLYQSKAGGLCLFQDQLPPGATFLLQLRSSPAGFNFADMTAIVFLDVNGEVCAELH